MDSFDHLPIACIINSKFIALHGGLSPNLETIENINRIDRICEPSR